MEQLGFLSVTSAGRLLAAALAFQLTAAAAFFVRPLRRLAGLPLGLGSAAGVWYAAGESDLVMAAAEGLALLLAARALRAELRGRRAAGRAGRIHG